MLQLVAPKRKLAPYCPISYAGACMVVNVGVVCNVNGKEL